MRLTIAIPTVNRAYCVARAVESALAQTSPDVDIIVSDNGSTDDTPAVLAGYSDPRLRKFRHDATIPVTDHGNFLLGQATGDLFLGLSDDDWLEPDFAARVLDLYRRRPEISFAYTGWWTEMAGLRIPALTGPELEPSLDFLLAYFEGKRNVQWCACVCRTADLRRIGPIPPGRIMGDMFYWTKLACEGPVGCVAAPLAHYTFLVDNTSLGTPVRAWSDDTAVMMDELRARLPALAPDPAWTRRFEAALVAYLARTTSNQFAWLAVRGASKGALLAALRGTAGRYAHDWRSVSHVVVACALPRQVVRAIFFVLLRRHSRQMTAKAARAIADAGSAPFPTTR